ncbi:molecular chaperone DnaJ [Tardibacter chloracetimidivorans]|uniref:Molecular chaperone DnaJ n=1 Tax=Tardibacter chloracetimidivorans TaxID=1921510 RepID=A0A1L3ZQM5_9SPHN|nr:J domain-containing protein [Tardibacter chloracetimidivorans]API57926.1 molecular chaperone DnaJ [Tardibacter chloracetimidivorans]
MADLYSTLGLKRGASEADIKKAYRKLAKELHPDRNKDNAEASSRFSEVTHAYDLLSDADKRAQYDRGEIDEQGNPRAPFGYSPGAGRGGFGGPRGEGVHFEFGEGGDFGDIFSDLFNGGQRRRGSPFGQRPQRRGADVAYRLQVLFEEAAALKPQRVTLSNGKTIDLKLPPGIESGRQMRLSGQGEVGPGGNGDALVTIEIAPHRFFKRDGDDVRLDLPVRLDEVVLGAKVKVPTVEGAVMLTVPAGSTSGRTLRLKERGFHRATGGRGDQLVTLMVDVPGGDAELESFVKQWESERSRNPRASLGV